MKIDELSVPVTQLQQEARDIFERQRISFRQCAPLGLRKRMEALDLLLQSVVNHQDAIVEAVAADFGRRSARETELLEIFPLVDEIRFVKRHLRGWMRNAAPRSETGSSCPAAQRSSISPLGWSE